MIKRVTFALTVAGLLFPIVGCGPDTGTKSVFVEDEMAKYRSTPEQIAAGMQSGGKPQGSDLKAIEKAGKEAAAEAGK